MEPTIKDRLIGTWSLVSLESEAADGTLTHPMGAQPAGLIVYTATGYMSVHIMQVGRTEFIAPALYESHALRYQEIGYLAYCGHFRTDEAAGLVMHDVAVSLYPEWLGHPQIRLVQFEGERLHLTTQGPATLQAPVTRLIWQRN